MQLHHLGLLVDVQLATIELNLPVLCYSSNLSTKLLAPFNICTSGFNPLDVLKQKQNNKSFCSGLA